MGQRLVIHMMNNNEEIANAYYHWSGYTSSSIAITQLLLKELTDELIEKCKINNELDYRLLAIRLLESTGAGICREDRNIVDEQFKNIVIKDAVDRNSGLISVSIEEMDNSNNWSEGDIFVHLDKKTIAFYVVIEADDDMIAEYIDEEYDDENKIDENAKKEYLEKLPHLILNGYTMENIPFDKFSEFSKAMASFGYIFVFDETMYVKIE